MMDSLNKLRSIARWFLITGVMAGLFFSSGEGVQLLPFSAVSGAEEANTLQLENGSSKFYSYSVHNSVAQSAAVKSKIQKKLKFFDFVGISRIGDDHRSPKFSGAANSQNYQQPILSKRSPVTATPSDRAPPAV